MTHPTALTVRFFFPAPLFLNSHFYTVILARVSLSSLGFTYTTSSSIRVEEGDSTQAQNISTGSRSNKPGSLVLGQLDMHSGKVRGHT